jgi:Fe-S-cluster-containing dehydrogenase component
MDNVSRREFIRKAALASGGCAVFLLLGPGQKVRAAHPAPEGGSKLEDYDWEQHRYAYLIDTVKCIGCGMCVKACKAENRVPDGFFRTWIERYEISEDGEAEVDSPNGGLDGFEENVSHVKVAKAFFVPKLCNHCAASPCVQVCPVGAGYRTKDGVVLVDPEHCVGCGYCVQACPYGSRFISHDENSPYPRTAQKCTLCYHRITKGLKPACVAACPVGARQLADMKNQFDPVRKRIMTERVGVLQPELLTQPQCYYVALDKEVR